MNRSLRMALCVLLIPAALRAEPIRIVDTGPGPSGLPGFSLYQGQSLAAEFRVPHAAVITAAQGWMLVWGGGMLGLSLYQGGGAVPGPLLFRSVGVVGSGDAAWRGLAGLTWPVTAGTYWIGFEPPGRAGMSGAMPYPSGRPLENGAAAHSDSGFRYFEADEVKQIGARVIAEPADTPAPVPEPASMLLLGTGLAGLAVRRRSRT